ncbi:MAG: hypothetical protein O3A31_02550 [Planctomycetota bacterium]|nr:hypothetical protein [Planctomycetota bacterium]
MIDLPPTTGDRIIRHPPPGRRDQIATPVCIPCRLRPIDAAVWHNDTMLIYAGIDEAGYGPMLGPLCVGCSVFTVDDADPADGPPNLWERLDDVVTRGGRDARRRIAVDDSKKLKGSNQAKAHPLRHLERGVLSFLSTRVVDGPDDRGHAPPPTDAALFAMTHTDLPTSVATPWYRSNTMLPVAHDADALAIDAARLDRGMNAAGVRLLDLQCEAIDAGEFNRRLAGGSNKASINLDTVVRHVVRIREASRSADPNAIPRIVCDRQGGRSHYRAWLQDCFPDGAIRILGETPSVSRYRVDDSEGGFVIGFETGSEDRHLPIALASMTAKYLRELAMIRMNRFFKEHIPELKPTAGYVQDGRRFVQEVAPVLETVGINRSEFIRTS